MKNILVLFFNFCFFLSSFVFSNQKLAVLDFERIFKNSLQYKRILNSINYDFYKRYLFLNTEINNLIKYKKKIKSLKLNNKKIYDLNIRKKNIFLKIDKLDEDINTKNISINNLFIFKIKRIVNSLIEKNKYDIIFDSNAIFYYNKNIFDITSYVVKKLS